MNLKLQTISLDALINAVPFYVRMAKQILPHPVAFAKGIQLNDADEFARAFKYVNGSVLITFLLMIPIMLAHSENLGKLAYVLRLLAQFAVFGVLLHYLLRLVGAPKEIKLKGTLAAYGYLGGTFLPLYIVLQYPLLAKFGTAAVLGGYGQSLQLASELASNPLLMVYETVFTTLASLASAVVAIRWISATHKIRKLRVFAAFMCAGAVGGLITVAVIVPLFSAISPALGLL